MRNVIELLSVLGYANISILTAIAHNYKAHKRISISPRGFVKNYSSSFSKYEKALVLICRANNFTYIEIESLFCVNPYCLPRSKDSLRDYYARKTYKVDADTVVAGIRKSIEWNCINQLDMDKIDEALDLVADSLYFR